MEPVASDICPLEGNGTGNHGADGGVLPNLTPLFFNCETDRNFNPAYFTGFPGFYPFHLKIKLVLGQFIVAGRRACYGKSSLL